MCQRLSQWVALRCKERPFRDWLRVPDEATAVSAVRAICSVKSRAEIDRDPVAAQRFHQFIRLPYADFTRSTTSRSPQHV